MNASCLPEDLQKTLQITGRVTPAKTAWPIAHSVLLRAQEGELELTATNGELTVRTRIPAAVAEAGAITLPNKLLTNLVQTLPREPVQLEVDDPPALCLRCQQVQARINGAPPEVFPPLPETGDNPVVVELKAEEFRKGIRRVAHCAATEHGRPVLTGILIELEGHTLTTVATDQYRLTVQQTLVETPVPERIAALVPARSLREAQHIAGNSEQPVQLTLPREGGHIRFLVGAEKSQQEVEIISQLLAGDYPEYAKLIPQDLSGRAAFDLEELRQSARRAELFNRSTHRVQFQLTRKGTKGLAVITSESRELGSHRTELRLAEMKGDDITIGLNGQYLQEALATLKGPQVILETDDVTSPVKLTLPENDEYVHMMAPVITLDQ